MKTAIVVTRPGRKIRLSKIDPDSTARVTKQQALERVAELGETLNVLQETFYPEHRRGILIIFQSIDTGGKDGSIKNLCRGFNPPGVRIASFMTPTHSQLYPDFLWLIPKAP